MRKELAEKMNAANMSPDASNSVVPFDQDSEVYQEATP